MSLEINIDQPQILEITLYRYNWKDNQIINHLLSNANILKTEDKNLFFIDVNDLNCIWERYEEEIQSFDSLTNENLMEEVNSLYFIHNIVENFINLRFLRIRVSYKRNFTRVKYGEDSLILNFIYKVLYAKIELKNKLSEESYWNLISLLKRAGLYTKTPIYEQTYLQIKVSDLLSTVERYSNYRINDVDGDDEPDEFVNELLYWIDPKTETDDAILLLVF